MDKKNRNIIIISIISLALVIGAITYAYFSARIVGVESASTISLTAGRMLIEYSEGNDQFVFNNIYPRAEKWATKNFTLTGYNTMNTQMYYTVYLNVITNTFPDEYLTYDLTLISGSNGSPIATRLDVPINGTGNKKLGTGYFVQANGATHQYRLEIYFKDNGGDQNDAQEAIFNARISLVEATTIKNIIAQNLTYTMNYSTCVSYLEDVYTGLYGEPNSEMISWIETMCTDGEVNNGTEQEPEIMTFDQLCSGLGITLQEAQSAGAISNLNFTAVAEEDIVDNFSFTNGQFVYTYRESTDDWGVALASGFYEPNNELAATINGKPVTSIANMFDQVGADLDLTNFDLTNITDMTNMFNDNYFTRIDARTTAEANRYCTDGAGGIHQQSIYVYVNNVEVCHINSNLIVGPGHISGPGN